MTRQTNQSVVEEFIFVGFSREQRTNQYLFVIVLCMYLITLVGNSLIIIAIHIDARLSTPMYFFLGNLSFLDICFTSSVVPQLLVHFLTSHKTISFSRCMTQLCISLTFGSTEFILLAAMAYDRYVAICSPLHYEVIMRKKVCIQLVLASWTGGFFNAMIQTGFTMRLEFCSFNTINHFACEVLAVIKLACSDLFVNEISLMVAGFIILLIPCIVVMLSYVYIIHAILAIHSSQGRYKAFSTCTSHLMVVTLCYGTAAFAYMNPKTSNSLNQDKILAFFYAVVTPMFNPLIYSLRNKEVKGALSKIAGKCISGGN
ncbi:olfactory receptor-like protein OLF3 [Pantherophis guttatus]|uniref:Olfactory receptor n=1 Tax=Pantherophis guttatus TaxID=94885 RepID=A0A6P9CI29_PANGU|nr:olfactory receptor-like protein OLF3 [Pantherophis guttatus]